MSMCIVVDSTHGDCVTILTIEPGEDMLDEAANGRCGDGVESLDVDNAIALPGTDPAVLEAANGADVGEVGVGTGMMTGKPAIETGSVRRQSLEPDVTVLATPQD